MSPLLIALALLSPIPSSVIVRQAGARWLDVAWFYGLAAAWVLMLGLAPIPCLVLAAVVTLTALVVAAFSP